MTGSLVSGNHVTGIHDTGIPRVTDRQSVVGVLLYRYQGITVAVVSEELYPTLS